MTLAQLALSIRFERRPAADHPNAAHLRWQKRNRHHCTNYKREWRAKKRQEGVCPT